MTDTKPTIDEQENIPPIDELICYQKRLLENYQVNPVVTLIAKNILASLEELKRIRESEMPEPENGFYTVTGVWWTTSMGEDKKHFVRKDDYNALKAYAQRKEAEARELEHLNSIQADNVRV